VLEYPTFPRLRFRDGYGAYDDCASLTRAGQAVNACIPIVLAGTVDGKQPHDLHACLWFLRPVYCLANDGGQDKHDDRRDKHGELGFEGDCLPLLPQFSDLVHGPLTPDINISWTETPESYTSI
jgi:hypothetical protein